MFTQLQTLFEQALEFPPEERALFIAEKCEGNEVLHAELLKLLANYDKAAAELGDSFQNFAPQMLKSASTEHESHSFAQKVFDKYRLIKQLGRGGMGSVWLAERIDGIQRTVAVKILHRGMDTEDMLHRFRNERRVLAKLQHPNIATFIDGGITEDGVLYFVMEYVEGKSVLNYLQQNPLSLENRIKLFKQIAHAVAFAHQNLILHRDIKPSNILVKPDGTVKLLDFGIAKVLQTEEEVHFSVFETETSSKMLTPHYASPEQLKGDDLSTQSDIYQLGTLLYEILTDRHPFQGLSKFDVQQAILNQTPKAPSQESTPFSKSLKGDLDTIVLACLRKEPERRYASVENLLSDLTAFTKGFPISIQKDSLKYRAQKFLHRNRTYIYLSTFFVFLLLLSGFYYTFSILQARNQANSKAQEAAQVSEFLKGIFYKASPQIALGDTLTVFELLGAGEKNLQNDLKDQPLVRASLLQTLAEVYENLGNFSKALDLNDEAFSLLKARNHPNQVWLLRKRGGTYILLNNYPKAKQDLEQALRLTQEFQSADSTIADIHNGLGIYYATIGNSAAALQQYRKAFTIYQNNDLRLYESDVLHNIGREYQSLDQLDLAEKTFKKVLTIRKNVLPPNHPSILETRTALAVLLYLQDRFAEAEPLFKDILKTRTTILGETHPQTLTSMNDVGVVLMKQNKLKEAYSYLATATAGRKHQFGANHSQTAQGFNNLGQWFRRTKDYKNAEHYFKSTLAIYLKLNNNQENLQTAIVHFGLAETYRDIGNLALARTHIQTCITVRKQFLSSSHRELKKAQNLLDQL